jgi:hypothetical protein
MSLTINSYFLPSYEVSCAEIATTASLFGCVGLPWAKRHWQLATEEPHHALGHRIIAFFQALPLLGGIVVVIERIFAAIASCCQALLAEKSDPRKNRDYLFLSSQEGRSQEGCRGSISIEKADIARQKLQQNALPGLSFDPMIYRNCPSIRGTCTVISLEFASAYFRLRKEFPELSPASASFLDKLRALKGHFEKSSEDMRSRQAAYSSITIDRSVEMDISRSKTESWIRCHNFVIDRCSSELNITTNRALLQQEINALPPGIYFIRMHKPSSNHKLEERGHSMIYVREEDIRLFYDNNDGLEVIPMAQRDADGLVERLAGVHQQWDIPLARLYRLREGNG